MWWDAPVTPHNAATPPREDYAARRPPALESIAAYVPPPSSSSSFTAISGSGGGGPSMQLSLQRNYLVGVTMLSNEVWLSINAASIDELCTEVERELSLRGELPYLDVLYLLCMADGVGHPSSTLHHSLTMSSPEMMNLSTSNSSSFGTPLATPTASSSRQTFALCPLRRRHEAEMVLFKKGRRGRAALIADDDDGRSNISADGGHHNVSPSSHYSPPPTSSSLISSYHQPAIMRIPTKFSCVVRCAPRAITINVLCVLSPLIRVEFGSGRGGAAAAETVDVAGLRVPMDPDVLEHLLQSRPSELFRVRTIVNDATSLSEVGIALYRQIEPLLRLRASGGGAAANGSADAATISTLDHLRKTITSSMQLYFSNPRDAAASQGASTPRNSHHVWSGAQQTRHFRPLFHIGQLAGLAHIICDVSAAHHSVYTAAAAAGNADNNASSGTAAGADRRSPLREKLLEIARGKPQHTAAATTTSTARTLQYHGRPEEVEGAGHGGSGGLNAFGVTPRSNHTSHNHQGTGSVLDTIRNRAAGQRSQQTLSPARRRDPMVSFQHEPQHRNTNEVTSFPLAPISTSPPHSRWRSNTAGVASNQLPSSSPISYHHIGGGTSPRRQSGVGVTPPAHASRDVYYHMDHLQRLGIDASAVNDHLVASKREEEGVDVNVVDRGHLSIDDGLASAWYVMPLQAADDVVNRRVSGSIVGDALRESATRFGGGHTAGGGRGGGHADDVQRHLQTPHKRRGSSPSAVAVTRTDVDQQQQHYVSLNANGQVVSRREAPNEIDEKRALIQVALHMLLSHPRRAVFPTSTLVTLIPNVVQAFRDQYSSTGIPLRFPLSKGDARDLQKIVDDSIAYEIAVNPNLPYLVEQQQSTNATRYQSPRGADRQSSPDGWQGRRRSTSPNFFEVNHGDDNDDTNGSRHQHRFRDVRDTPPMVDRLPVVPPLAHHVLVLAKPFFDAQTKRLLVFATIGIDIFDGPSAALHQSSRPYYSAAADAGGGGAANAAVGGQHHRGGPVARRSVIPFRWFLRTTKANFNDAPSKELPIDTLFALGIAKTHVISYTVPITVSLEVNLDPDQDWSHISEGHERVLVHRWRAGGVANVLSEGLEYVVGIEIHRRDVPESLSMANGGSEGEFIQATQAFVIPVGSGAAPQTRSQMYDMLLA